MATLITAGCGISQMGFDKWITWPKYCELTHHCKHINVGGPASGNEHIARSVVRSIYENTPDAVIVVWTSYNKLDVYVEDVAKELEIKNFPSRNFLINYLGKIVDSPAWWPSSVSDDNVIKKLYKETIESNTYYYIRTLESVLAVQNLCRLKNISCYMFLGYNWDIEKIKLNEETAYLYKAIDWSQFVSLASLAADYERSSWFEYNTTKKHGMIPVAGWHYDFYVNQIIPLLDHHYNQKDLTKFWQLEKYVLNMTQDCYRNQIS
jgi:hypothetical protein